MAKKIIDVGKRATGAMVEVKRVLFTLAVRMEVIVSAPTIGRAELVDWVVLPSLCFQFHSPQLLMVSGIGLATILQQIQYPMISDLPAVGQNPL